MASTVKVNTTTPKLDETGKEVKDKNGDVIMVPVSYSFSMSNSADRAKLAKELKIDTSTDSMTEQYVVSLKTNSNNEITRINVLNDNSREGYFNKSDKMIGNYLLNSDTVVFTLPAGEAFDEDNLKATSYTNLDNEKTYTFKVCDTNKDGVVTAIIVYTNDSNVNADSEIAVIQSVTTTKVDDDTVLSLTMIQGGKIVTRNTKEDDQFFINSTMKDMYGDSAKIAYGAYPGQIIMYSTNSAGAIADTFRLFPRPCAKADYVEGYYMNDLFQTWDNNPDRVNDKARLYIGAGIVTKKSNKTKIIEVKSGASNKVVLKTTDFSANYENARVIVVDTNLSNEELAVKVGSSSDINDGDYVVVRKNKGSTKDIVVYKNFEAAPAYFE